MKIKPERLARMNSLDVLASRIRTGLAIAMLTAMTGCVGVVDDGGYSDGDVGVGVGWWGSWWGGDYDRGRDVHGYSDRGAASRGAAHGGGGGVRASGGAAHASSGGGHGGGGGRR